MSLCNIEKLVKTNLSFGVTILSVRRGELCGFSLSNNKGYIIELCYDKMTKTLFIADEKDYNWLHEASFVFVNDTFKNRCIWVSQSKVKYISIEGLLV